MKNLNNSLGAIVLTNCWKLLQNNLNSKVFQPPTPELQSKSKHCASGNIHHLKNVLHLKFILWTRNNLIHWHFSWLHNFNSSYNEHLECRAGFDYRCFFAFEPIENCMWWWWEKVLASWSPIPNILTDGADIAVAPLLRIHHCSFYEYVRT